MGTIEKDPALFGTPDRVTWNTPANLTIAVTDFWDSQGLAWLDPCSNEHSLLSADIAVMLPTPERLAAWAHGVDTGSLLRTEWPPGYVLPACPGGTIYVLADGLALDWDALAGGVYCNPPYGSRGPGGAAPWIEKDEGVPRDHLPHL
jgi:hypothetical protein